MTVYYYALRQVHGLIISLPKCLEKKSCFNN